MEINDVGSDDWGDFGAVINELEAQEVETQSGELGEYQEDAPQSAEDKSEALAGMLNVAFVLTEQATSAISGIDFEFDEKGKAAVIEAAQPVIAKHGDTLMSVFGDYIEEVTLLIAVVSLAYTSKRHIAELKAQRGEHGEEETETATDATSN